MPEHVNDLGKRNGYNPATQNMLQEAAFMARGMDAATATKQAYAAMYGMVQQQAAMMGYIDVFLLLALMFAACLSADLPDEETPEGWGRARERWHTRVPRLNFKVTISNLKSPHPIFFRSVSSVLITGGLPGFQFRRFWQSSRSVSSV